MATGWPLGAYFLWSTAALVAAASVALVLWALLWERARGRLRCPACWQEISPIQGLRCPECGRTARRREALRRTRRRWRWALLGLALIPVAGLAAFWPRARRDGWPSIVPTTALVAGSTWLTGPPRGSGLDSLRGSLRTELEGRASRDGLWDWQWSWLIRKCAAGAAGDRPPSWAWYHRYQSLLSSAEVQGQLDRPSLKARIHPVSVVFEVITRDRWPEDVPLRVDTLGLQWHGRGGCLVRATPLVSGMNPFQRLVSNRNIRFTLDPSWDSTVDVGVPPAGIDHVAFDVEFIRDADYKEGVWSGGEVFGRHRIVVPVRVGGSLDDVLPPYRSEQLEALLAANLNARLHVGHLDLWWQSERWFEIKDRPGKLAMGFEVQMAHDGEIVAKGVRAAVIDDFCLHTDVLLEGELMEADLSAGTWTARILDNPEVALRCFGCDARWIGQVTVTVEPKYTGVSEPAAPFQSEAFDRLLVQRLRARLVPRRYGGIWLELDANAVQQIPGWPGRVIFCVEGEILAEGEVLATLEDGGCVEIDLRGAGGWIGQDADYSNVLARDTSMTSLRLRLRPMDVAHAVGDRYRHYWDGEITIPLESH